MSSVEINDAQDCNIIFGDAPVTPLEKEARVCTQCGHATWAKTAVCMWCGHDRWAPVVRYGSIVVLLLITALLLHAITLR